MFQVWPEEENRRLLLNEQQIQDLRIKRNKTRLPQSLSALAIQSVCKNVTRFVDVPDSPLKYLPNANTIVQQLLSKIASDFRKEKMLIPLPQLMQVLGLLLNPSVTELDCTVFQESRAGDENINNFLYKHALEHCPKIRKIKLSKGIVFHQCHRGHYLPIESFKKSWNNLTTIICQSFFKCNQNTLMFLQENFPNIEVLTVCLIITGPTAQTVLDHLINMKRLHTLSLDVVATSASYRVILQFFIDVAGTVPSLQNFNFGPGRKNDSNFIDLFGEKYPSKKLLMDKLRIEMGLIRKWPKNLSVKHLIIDGYLSDTADNEIENLSTIECTLDLTMSCMLAERTYKVLDCIGGLVKKLAIKDTNKRLEEIYVEYDTDIILERILAACPNLKHFEIICPSSVVQDPNYNLTPAAFKNYKSFQITGWKNDVVLQQVYRKFLIGSEVCESLEHMNNEQLETLAQVALAYPESLQQLRELHITPSASESSSLFDFYNDAFEKYDKCFYELITCCHKLERIILYMRRDWNAIEAPRENRYLAAIQSIDPYFIQKSWTIYHG